MPGAAQSYADANLAEPAALIVGAEDTGLDDLWRAIADEEISIPMHATTVDSLNASVATAVLLFEARRQRDVRSGR